MNAIIEKIRIFPEKGSAGTEAAEARLIENMGLEGDFHATGGDRQVSLLFAETRGQLTEQKEKGLCFSRFKENISIRGMAPDAVKTGARLGAGEAILEITGKTKRCHGECPLYDSGKPCPLAGRSLFAKVIKSGVIRTGEQITNNK